MIAVSSLIRGLLDRAGFALWRRRIPAWYTAIPAPGRAERFRQYCMGCREETPHHGFDEVGAGYYAQISRCRRCGREGMSIWPFT